ncbi:MAG: hypothetical protein J7J76_08315 [Candidatus Latescibacteria bacterium]|nr:hypothetical protein [Candidatus Latescibacterota bacterium]
MKIVNVIDRHRSQRVKSKNQAGEHCTACVSAEVTNKEKDQYSIEEMKKQQPQVPEDYIFRRNKSANSGQQCITQWTKLPLAEH